MEGLLVTGNTASVVQRRIPSAGGDADLLNTAGLSGYIGCRCDTGKRYGIGTVRFLGETCAGPGIWAGVELDNKEGKHDGTVLGIRYFVCNAGYGLLTRVDKLRSINERDRIEVAKGRARSQKILRAKSDAGPRASSRTQVLTDGAAYASAALRPHRNLRTDMQIEDLARHAASAGSHAALVRARHAVNAVNRREKTAWGGRHVQQGETQLHTTTVQSEPTSEPTSELQTIAAALAPPETGDTVPPVDPEMRPRATPVHMDQLNARQRRAGSAGSRVGSTSGSRVSSAGGSRVGSASSGSRQSSPSTGQWNPNHVHSHGSRPSSCKGPQSQPATAQRDAGLDSAAGLLVEDRRAPVESEGEEVQKGEESQPQPTPDWIQNGLSARTQSRGRRPPSAAAAAAAAAAADAKPAPAAVVSPYVVNRECSKENTEAAEEATASFFASFGFGVGPVQSPGGNGLLGGWETESADEGGEADGSSDMVGSARQMFYDTEGQMEERGAKALTSPLAPRAVNLLEL